MKKFLTISSIHLLFIVIAASCQAGPPSDTASGSFPKDQKVVKTNDQWKVELDPEVYYVTREKGTERAFTGKYWNHKDNGVYTCSNCGLELFSSDTKFKSGTGWPSYYDVFKEGNVAEVPDNSHGWNRMEVVCARCDAHLGHLFDDGPAPTGLRYCVNSASLLFEPK